MTRVKMTVCNRCGHTAKEDEFEGMDVQIFDQGGSGDNEDSFTLCDPCADALRKWIVTKPSSACTCEVWQKEHSSGCPAVTQR